MIDRLLRIITPHSCCSCGYLGTILCQQCNDDIISEPFSQCLVCLRPTSVSNLCGTGHERDGYMDAWCVGIRETHLKALLDRYKFDSARQAADTLSALLDARLPVFPVSAVVVPVPTSPAHRRIRGFDHMALIGRRLAQCRGLTFSEVLATDRTDTQHFKNRAQRQAAAAVGLRIRRPVPDTIVLIDDIYTTGSTLRACVRYLLTHGAQRVFVAVIARQTLDESDDL